MRIQLLSCAILLALAALGFSAPPAGAQASRTWVSHSGLDSNDCSVATPCMTFAGAYNKTSVGGEIDALDSGGFGAVTISHSLTIRAVGAVAGVLVSGTNGIVINAGASGRVDLYGLDLEGSGTGPSGIDIVSAGRVRIERCSIRDFKTGLSVATTTTGFYSLNDSTLSANTTGILVKPSGAAAARLLVNHVNVFDSSIGIEAAGANAEIVLNDATVFANGTGLAEVASPGKGTILSFGNNHVTGNTANGTPTKVVAPE
jgi:hypothetical protein